MTEPCDDTTHEDGRYLVHRLLFDLQEGFALPDDNGEVADNDDEY